MDDKTKKTADIIKLFKSGEEPDTTARIKVKGNNNIVAGGDIKGDININTRRITRTTVQPGPHHISDNTAKKIQDTIESLVEKETAGGMNRPSAFAKWYGVLKKRYQVPSYRAIPRELGEEALSWLQQQSSIKRSKIRRTDNDRWRNELYTAIWARAENLGISKGEVYNMVLQQFGKRVSSLKQVGERDLKKLYNIIMSTK